jgi:phosphatidylserine/phosphatidylglycerophosphate/cardiolipin synthase-like enzyme
VQPILDRSNRTAHYSVADTLHNLGIPVLIDAKHAIAHNKVIIIDGETVVTGSFNFTKQAETSNAENLLIIRDKDLSAKYAEDWRKHAEHLKPYEMPEAKDH